VTPSLAGWTDELARARLHFVTGKGGTGKTTVAAALAMALAHDGRRVLLIEVEGRQGIAQLFGTQPLPYSEQKVAAVAGGGEIRALNIDVEAALLEYFEMFYNLGIAGRTLRRMGAVEFATTLAPGLRDVVLTGKIKECVTRTETDGRHSYDAVVVDSPPTGRVVKFLDVTKALSDLTKTGPIRSQADGVVRLLHSGETAIHLVTLLEEMPVRETVEAVTELDGADLRPGAVIMNRVQPTRLPAEANEAIDVDRIREELTATPLPLSSSPLSDKTIDALIEEAVEHSIRQEAEHRARNQLSEADLPTLELAELTEGMDVSGLYDLADALVAQEVR
jgi:anion-transporting  ArsA/GET3 family ATPase